MKSIDTKLAKELWAQYYEKFGKSWLTGQSNSMMPLIQPGDSVLICRTRAEEILRGDIVVFRRNGDLIGHRVLKRQCGGEGIRFTEKGDSSSVWGKFMQDDIIGRVSAVKSRRNLFVLDSTFGKFLNHAISLWCYYTTALAMKLRSSDRRNIRICGAVIARISLLSSNIMIRMCSVFWYLSGMRVKRKNQLSNHLT
jgi:signal peptidase I